MKNLLLSKLITCVILISAMGVADLAFAQVQSVAEDGFSHIVKPFFKEYCFQCHAGDNALAEMRLDELTEEFDRNSESWREITRMIRTGQMPPSDEANQPDSEESEAVADWIYNKLIQFEASQAAQRRSVSFNRMSRQEYANTITDLLGVDFHVDDGGRLNDDETWDNFSRIGSALTISASHIEKYLSAAETILSEAYPDREPIRVTESFDALMLTGGVATFGKEKLQELTDFDSSKKARVDLWPGQEVRFQPKEFWDAGVYRFRIQLSGLKSGNAEPPHFSIYDRQIDRLLFEQDVVAAENEPIVLQFEIHLPAGKREFDITNEVNGPLILQRFSRTAKPFYSIDEGYLPWQLSLIDSSGTPNYPCLIVDSVTVEGPLVDQAVLAKRNRFWPTDEADHDAIFSCLERLAEQAFRRPVTRSEIARFFNLALKQLDLGESPRSAIKTAMQAILVSKDFLYLVEGESKTQSSVLTDWELASRLSYFLWSSMPDAELFELARQGKLSDRSVLQKQVERMLADPRATRLTGDFARQWLQLDRVGMFKPNAKLYPECDAYLERSMVQETIGFFDSVLQQNLTLREFIISDWVYINPRLARHYGIDLKDSDAEQDCFRKVPLQPIHHRGGVLTQASVLSLTSDGTRHRPVHRGVWLLESILGRSIPPPPASVDPIEPNPVDAKKSTVRMKLQAHTTNSNCMACHRKIDPLGFAFDNYDAIGRWRSTEAVPMGVGEDPDVDASGELPDGRVFEGPQEFQQLLLSDIDVFNEAFIKKMAAYALRRPLTLKDELQLNMIAETSKVRNYRLRDIVEAIVLSDLFQAR